MANVKELRKFEAALRILDRGGNEDGKWQEEHDEKVLDKVLDAYDEGAYEYVGDEKMREIEEAEAKSTVEKYGFPESGLDEQKVDGWDVWFGGAIGINNLYKDSWPPLDQCFWLWSGPGAFNGEIEVHLEHWNIEPNKELIDDMIDEVADDERIDVDLDLVDVSAIHSRLTPKVKEHLDSGEVLVYGSNSYDTCVAIRDTSANRKKILAIARKALKRSGADKYDAVKAVKEAFEEINFDTGYEPGLNAVEESHFEDAIEELIEEELAA